MHNGTVVATQTTSANGEFLFENLDPGSGYSLRFASPSGYSPTLQDSGDDSNDSDINPNTYTTVDITLNPGQIDLKWFAGFVHNADHIDNPESTNTGGTSKDGNHLAKTGFAIIAIIALSSVLILVSYKISRTDS